MNRCSICVMPDTRPDTPFVDGVCQACINFKARQQVDWNAREGDFLRLLESIPRNGSGYDCIVPSSGGKDSTWQVLKCIELGLRPLVVTATTCMLTDIGRKNIDNLARYATTVEFSPNKEVRKKLNRLGLEMVGDCSWPEHVSIFTTPFRAAVAFGIPLVLYGENPQAHYGGPQGTEQATQLTERWRSEFGGFLGLRPRDLIGIQGLTAEDMADYEMPTSGQIPINLQAHFLGQYFPWDSWGNFEAATMSGFVAYHKRPCTGSLWAFENLDNAQTGLHDHAMFRKYGYGRACAQVSIEVRTGRIDREMAMRAVEGWDGSFPNTYMGVPFEAVCRHIGMDPKAVVRVLDQFTDWTLHRDVSPKMYPVPF